MRGIAPSTRWPVGIHDGISGTAMYRYGISNPIRVSEPDADKCGGLPDTFAGQLANAVMVDGDFIEGTRRFTKSQFGAAWRKIN